MATKLPTDPIVASDIVNSKIAAALDKAASNAASFKDTVEGRAALAQAAQDYLIALRLLRVPYNKNAISLQESGDLYIFGQPCHPRAAADRISQGFAVADLVDVVVELEQLLAYEGEPGPVVAAVPVPDAVPSSSSPAPVAAAPAAAPFDVGALAQAIVAALNKSTTPTPAGG